MCRAAANNYRFYRSTVFPYEEFVHKAALKPDNPAIALLYVLIFAIIRCVECRYLPFQQQVLSRFG